MIIDATITLLTILKIKTNVIYTFNTYSTYTKKIQNFTSDFDSSIFFELFISHKYKSFAVLIALFVSKSFNRFSFSNFRTNCRIISTLDKKNFANVKKTLITPLDKRMEKKFEWKSLHYMKTGGKPCPRRGIRTLFQKIFFMKIQTCKPCFEGAALSRTCFDNIGSKMWLEQINFIFSASWLFKPWLLSKDEFW